MSVRILYFARNANQVKSIGIWLLLQILHDVAVFVPGKHHAKVRESRRYSVEREYVVVIDLLHQHHFFAKTLHHVLDAGTKTGVPHYDVTYLHFWSFVRGGRLGVP